MKKRKRVLPVAALGPATKLLAEGVCDSSAYKPDSYGPVRVIATSDTVGIRRATSAMKPPLSVSVPWLPKVKEASAVKV